MVLGRVQLTLVMVVALLLLSLQGAQAIVAGPPNQDIPAQTITANTTWPNIGVPYHVNGSITVAAGVTLTIAAGTELALRLTPR